MATGAPPICLTPSKPRLCVLASLPYLPSVSLDLTKQGTAELTWKANVGVRAEAVVALNNVQQAGHQTGTKSLEKKLQEAESELAYSQQILSRNSARKATIKSLWSRLPDRPPEIEADPNFFCPYGHVTYEGVPIFFATFWFLWPCTRVCAHLCIPYPWQNVTKKIKSTDQPFQWRACNRDQNNFLWQLEQM